MTPSILQPCKFTDKPEDVYEEEGIRLNWFRFLARRDISEKEWKIAKNLAGDWVMCGCGNLCDAIPRHTKQSAPIDERLMTLGIRFSQQVYRKERYPSLRTLYAIEKRAAEVLRTLGVLKDEAYEGHPRLLTNQKA